METNGAQYPNVTELTIVTKPLTSPLFINNPGSNCQNGLVEQIGQALNLLDRNQITDLLSRYTKVTTKRIDVYLDYENLHISLKKTGRILQPKSLMEAVESAVQHLGTITSIKAYADWASLRKSSGYDIQHELEVSGVKTHYTLKGKNSADIAMLNGLRDALEKEIFNQNKIDTFIIGTGDGDFQPVVETIKKRGKQVVILACKNSLSQLLRRDASEIIYLTDYLKPKNYSYQRRTASVPIGNGSR